MFLILCDAYAFQIVNFAASNQSYIMELNALTAISPVDGRYHNATKSLSAFYSEAALIRYRLWVEIEYFIELCEIPLPQLSDFPKSKYEQLRSIYRDFEPEMAQKVKQIEKTTNHDVKAIEYYIKEKFDTLDLQKWKEFIHFGLTSQDINNTAIPLSHKEASEQFLIPTLEMLIEKLTALAKEWMEIPMLARTHGQPASPTSLGKEIYVFAERLNIQLQMLKTLPYPAKFGGATGNFNAHHIAYPQVDWIKFANHFVNQNLELNRSQTTTQIEHYDNLAAIFDAWKRINTILIDFSRDIWSYVSMEYFKQKIKAGEVGSSAMPHKVNPIDFENAEGNAGIANALLEHLAAKLPISRLQRDLTDSTVLRNIGMPFAHIQIAFNSINKGLDKLIVNKAAIEIDLENNWAVVAEAIQTVLRREGFENPYEMLKDLTRTHQKINAASLGTFIESLHVEQHIKDELLKISPFNYTGIKPVI